MLVLEKNIYNILFHILTFSKPSCDNVLQPSPLRDSGCNTLSHSGLANVNTRGKECFIFFIIYDKNCFTVFTNVATTPSTATLPDYMLLV